MKIAVAALVLTVIIAWVLLRARRPPAAGPEIDLQAGMKGVAAEAVEVARARHNVVLDYSPESVEKVERILAELHVQHQEEPFPLTREKDEAWRWGAYVGEVILRLTPGRWEVDHEAGGPRSYPVRVSRGDSFPMGWCRKRIVRGPEDNVWHKFQILYMRNEEAVGFTVNPDGRVDPH